jgi:aminoglycoside phosphotransferase
MDQPDPKAMKWLSDILTMPFTAKKHDFSHQDQVFKIETDNEHYYLKISPTIKRERDNLKKIQTLLNVPKVINFYDSGNNAYLLISELPGKNLVELIGEWSDLMIVNTFATAMRKLHSIDATSVFEEAGLHDVLLHGDMALPNIIISHKKTGYVDFGQLAFGTPEQDIVDALWSLQRNISPNYGEIFLKKYGPVVITPTIRQALKFRYSPSVH